MIKEKIVKLVNSVFIEFFEFEPSELEPEKRIFADLGLDSLDIVDLMVGLQRKFGVPLRQNEELRKIETLGDIYNVFEKLISEQPELAKRLENLDQE